MSWKVWRTLWVLRHFRCGLLHLRSTWSCKIPPAPVDISAIFQDKHRRVTSETHPLYWTTRPQLHSCRIHDDVTCICDVILTVDSLIKYRAVTLSGAWLLNMNTRPLPWTAWKWSSYQHTQWGSLFISTQRSLNTQGCRGYETSNSRFAPSQWETALLCNDVSHWLGASLESAMFQNMSLRQNSCMSTWLPTTQMTSLNDISNNEIRVPLYIKHAVKFPLFRKWLTFLTLAGVEPRELLIFI